MKTLELNLGMYTERLSSDVEDLTTLFNGCTSVQLWDVDKLPSGHGHFKISVEFIINGVTKKFSSKTSNMSIIDNWNDDDGNITGDTIMEVINYFEDEIKEYIYFEIED